MTSDHLNGLNIQSLDATNDTHMLDTGESENEKDDVAIITLDQSNGDLETPSEKPRADEFEVMKEAVLPPLLEQPRILSDTINTWEIKDWRKLPRRTRGPVFEAGGFPWRILMFPTGNSVDQASFYLEHGFTDKPPDDFVCCVQFALVLWNPKDPTIYHFHTAHHRFTGEEGDWGFTRFVELRKLFHNNWEGHGRPLVENDEANMTAYVRIVEDETGVLWHNFHNYDSKKETGFAGLKNQGATCYLNSLLQSLYLTNAFRKAVYQIPTQDEETLENSAYTLQRLFYQLQISSNAVSTNELTKSFGWDTKQIFEQQDVQELSRKLMERLEEKMKGTQAENVLPQLFSAKVRTYIECIHVDYVSSRVEDFWDIQLNVQGTKNLEQSLADYISVETMDGDNKYYAGDEYKLQDANKGVIFESFPDILNLQLKRFEYNIEADAMTKVNSRYEFPETFDATPYLSNDADKSESYIYQLHSVLVHAGDLNAGHYYAFIRPTIDGWFYRYDDDRVNKATMREVLEENYGGPYLTADGKPELDKYGKPILRTSSAYMLVYIRQSRAEKILLPLTVDDTPSHLQKRFEAEAAEREARRKEREESHLYMNVKVITQNTFRAFGGTDLTVWDVPANEENPGAAKLYRVLRQSTLQQLTEKIGAELDMDPKLLRFWNMVNRQNKTTRPDQPLQERDATLEAVHQKTAMRSTELRLWAEVCQDVSEDGEPKWPSPHGDLICIFFKHFDYEQQTLSGVGHVYISREKRVEDLGSLIISKLNWPKETQISLFEEIKPQMIEPLKAKQTLKAAELQDGDIVCFQKAPSDSAADNSTDASTEANQKSLSSRSTVGSTLEDVRSFYDFLIHKKTVTFLPWVKQPDNPGFRLELSSKTTYEQLAARVGEKLDIRPTHLKFYTVLNNGNPKNPVKRINTQVLHNILQPSTFANTNQKTDSLMYEVLDMSLAELETKKLLKVTWWSDDITKEETFDVLAPKNGSVSDIIAILIMKAGLEKELEAGAIRVYEVTSHNKIHRSLSHETSVSNINDYVKLVAERVPEDERDEKQTDFISTFHFEKDPAKSHGIPFYFRIMEGEKFSETKKRLEQRIGIKGKAFEKIKFAVVKKQSFPNPKPQYLTDDDIIWEKTASEDFLGLDHVDKHRQLRNGGQQELFLK